ncbi:MAG: LysE family translocator [Actinomycetia bacterium]|nr:LysE family translocator [Actinomycetes bacterium]MCP5030835.1 LysE family translocator [Actinomycetes bacterium]
MSFGLSIAAIMGTLLVGTISPGPSFVMVAQKSVATSRRTGIVVATGMGMGGVIFAALALAGLRSVLEAVPTVYIALRIIGGAYLVALAVRIWRGADRDLQVADTSDPSQRHSMMLGLTTQLANPKTAIVYASTFAAFLPEVIEPLYYLAVLPAVFLVEFGWYSAVAIVLSAPRPRKQYLRAKTRIDRVTSCVLGALGTRLVLNARATAG